MTSDALHVVIGAGPLGAAVAADLASQGRRVRLVSRTTRSASNDIEPIAADMMNEDEATRALAGASVVYQCAAPAYHRWIEQFPMLQENALRAAMRAGAVFVAAENLYGYGVAGDLHEGLPLSATTRKGKVRARLTERLFEAHESGKIRAVAGRASDFVGPGVLQSALGERFWPNLLAGKPVDWFGDPDARHTFTFVPDFAHALVRLGDEERAWGRAWHVPSPPTLSPRDVIARAAALSQVSVPRIRRTPAIVLKGVGLFVPAAGEMVEMAYAFAKPLIMSHRAYEDTFGAQATAWDEVLTSTLNWWRNAKAA
jgi:nucleoside-diphosphate-sugar epimerase